MAHLYFIGGSNTTSSIAVKVNVVFLNGEKLLTKGQAKLSLLIFLTMDIAFLENSHVL